MSKKVMVIGAGFSGLAAAACLARAGADVTVLEKNDGPGGRAREFREAGFQFDMGPSWYWMPDVFEQFFARFGRKPSDFYDLKRLDPSYQVFFGEGNSVDLPADMPGLEALFEQREPGSALKLRQFLAAARFKYETGMRDFVFRPGHSPLEFFHWKIAAAAFRLQLFSSISGEVRRLFKNPELIQLLEFPVLFLGATPEKTPALYSMMNYADFALGTWYPMGGMHKIVEGMVSLAREEGVKFEFLQEISRISVENGRSTGVQTASQFWPADAVVASADYHHVEQKLLEPAFRKYDESYWKQRVMAPSSLIFYLGIDRRLKNLRHHNLFFDRDFKRHAQEIYESPAWPTDPLFYVCAPSVTDSSVAPDGCENLFVLIPVAPGLDDGDDVREHYFQLVMARLEALTGQAIRPHVIFRRDYAHRDFIQDYHAFRGNAYGLANTLRQTAFLKPKMCSPLVGNLFFTGQLTVPGPGVPPALISGQVVAKEVLKIFD